MSQIYKNSSSSPPVVATSYVTDINSPAVPAANVLNVVGGSSTSSTESGIRTDGSSGGNTLTVQLTNRASGQVTTTDDTPTAIITLNLANTTTTYSISGVVTVLVPGTGFGASYDFQAAMRTNGISATEIGTEYPTTFEDPSLAAADIQIVATGNTASLRVIGIPATIIYWDAYLTYRQRQVT